MTLDLRPSAHGAFAERARIIERVMPQPDDFLRAWLDPSSLRLPRMAGAANTVVFVDPTGGSDTNSGLSAAAAVKTLAKAATIATQPADEVWGKRGELFREQAVLTHGGASGAPVVFDAYGPDPVLHPDGRTVLNNPTIVGSERMTGWTAWNPPTSAPELDTSGDFDTAWAGSPAAPVGWTASQSGASVVTRETGTVYSGTAAVKLDVDATGNAVSISRVFTGLTVGQEYTIAFRHKDASKVGGTAQMAVQIQLSGGARGGQNLQADGTFQPGNANPTPLVPNSGAGFAAYSLSFLLPSDAATTSVVVILKRSNANATHILDAPSFKLFTLPGGAAPNTFRVACPVQAKVVDRNDVRQRPAGVAGVAGGRATLISGSFWWEGGYLYLRDDAGNPDTTGAVVEAGQRPHGFFVQGISDVTIRRWNVRGTNGRGMRFNSAPRCAWEDGWARLTTNGSNDQVTGTATGENGGGSFAICDDARISRCRADGMTSEAFYFYDCVRYVLEDCIATTCFGDYSDNWQSDFSDPTRKATGGGIVRRNWFSQALLDGPKGNGLQFGDNVLYEDNYVEYGNFGYSQDANHGTVHRNHFFRCGAFIDWGAGLFMGDDGGGGPQEQQDFVDNLFAYNTMVECRRGVFVGATAKNRTGLRYFHNTAIDSTVADYHFKQNVDADFRNNVGWTTPGRAKPTLARLTMGGVAAGGAFTSDYNMLAEDGATPVVRWIGTNYTTLAAAHAATGNETHSFSADPLLRLAPGGHHAGVLAGSPLLGAGVAIAGVTVGSPHVGASQQLDTVLSRPRGLRGV